MRLALLGRDSSKNRDERDKIFSKPTQALAGLLKCRVCNGELMEFTARSQFGCANANRRNCSNASKLFRKEIEAILIEDLEKKFLSPQRANDLSLRRIQSKVQNLLEIVEGNTEFEELSEKLKAMRSSLNDNVDGKHAYYVANTTIQTLALLEEV